MCGASIVMSGKGNSPITQETNDSSTSNIGHCAIEVAHSRADEMEEGSEQTGLIEI